jgi:hypothetical protein
LKRAFLGWLRGEREHCKMAAIPTLAEEDAKAIAAELDMPAPDPTEQLSELISRIRSAVWDELQEITDHSGDLDAGAEGRIAGRS